MNYIIYFIYYIILLYTIIKNYNLDPAWYYTAPGLAWEAMLKNQSRAGPAQRCCYALHG